MGILAKRCALVLVVGLALVGCSPSDDDINDALGDLPGVVEAKSSCHDFLCTIAIDAESTASADELAEMLTAARTVDHATGIEVSLVREQIGAFEAKLSFTEAPTSEDADVAALLAWAAANPAIGSFEVNRVTSDRVYVSGSGIEGSNTWSIARELWPMANALTDARMTLVRMGPGGVQSVEVLGSLPETLLDAAADVETRSGVTGVLVTNDLFLVGVRTRSHAEEQRLALADEALVAGVEVKVAVTDNVIATSFEDDPGSTERLEPVLAAIEDLPEVSSTSLSEDTIHVEVDEVRSYPLVVERVRQRAGDAFIDATLVLTTGLEANEVEITPNGDDAVIDLVLALLPTPGLEWVHASQEHKGDPTRAAVGLTFGVLESGPGTGHGPPVGPYVKRLARVLATTPGTAPSYSLGFNVEDVDGRSANAGWAVDRTADGFTLGEIDGTPEEQADIRTAWTQEMNENS